MKAFIRPLLAVVSLWAVVALAEVGNAPKWHRLVGILQYLEADYPGAVASQDAFELKEQKSFMAEAVAVSRELGPKGAPFSEKLQALQKDVEAGQNPEGVSTACGELVKALTLEGNLVRSPKRPPELEKGKAIFASACASCHGPLGDGMTEIAETMKPPPANFQDAAVMAGLSPYKAYNSTGFGITGTAMPAFPQLSEEDRWSVAFYLFTLRHKSCEGKIPSVPLEELASKTDEELTAAYGADALPCLRLKLPALNETGLLKVAIENVEKALTLAKASDFEGARQAALDGYLNGLEPVESSLRARNKDYVLALEEAFFAVRTSAEQKSADTAVKAEALLKLLKTPPEKSQTSDFWAVFFASLLILLREGFEAMVVVGALLAVLKKMKAVDQARMVHWGWAMALVAGGVLFVVGRNLIAGAEREWLEGVVALLAVAMLVYAAVWLNSKANTREFMGDIRGQMQSALGKGSSLGLFAISFSAVFRESFETALFLQGLANDSVAGTTWGAVAGLLALVVLVVFIQKVGFVLPMKQLFSLSTLVLLVTSVVMLGKGLHALQEVGVMPMWPLGDFDVEFLGVWLDGYTLLPQTVLTAALLVWSWRDKTKARR